MDTQELTNALRHADAQELLRSGPLARLAYNGEDGLPRVIPIGFHWDGERVVVCTATNSPKVRSLSLRPNVAVTIDTGSTPATARSLQVRGIAALDTVDGVPEEFIAAAAKSLTAAEVAQFRQNTQSVYTQMVRIAIEPQWARFYDFGGGRVPEFMTNGGG